MKIKMKLNEPAGMRNVLILALGMFALGLDAYVLAALLPGIGASFDVSVSTAGFVVTGFTLAYGLISPLLAAASSAFNRRAVLISSLAVFALANIASTLATSFWAMMLTRIVAGAAAGLYAPSAAASAVSLVPAQLKARALALMLGGLTAALTLGVPVGAFVANHFGWRTALLLVVGISGLAVLGIAFRLPSLDAATSGLRERFALLANPKVLGRVTVMLLSASASLGLYTYLVALLPVDVDRTQGSMSGYFLIWGLAGALGNGVSGFLLDRGFSAAGILTASLIAMAVAMGALPLIGHMKAGIAIILFVWGWAAWSLQVPLQHQLMGIAPESTSTAIALLASGVYLGSAIGSASGGFVLSVSVDLLGPASALVVLLALLLHLLTTPESTKNRMMS